MGMLEVNITVAGQRQLSRAIAGVSNAPRNMIPAWRAIRDDFYRREEATFEAEGAFEGKPKWAALGERYRREKIAAGFPDWILVRTKDMMNSLTAYRPEVGSIYEERPDYMIIGTADFKAIMHQKGLGALKVRKPIDLSLEQRKDITKIIEEQIRENIDRSVSQPRRMSD